MAKFRSRLRTFLFPQENDRWLSYLRIGLGLEIVLYVLSLRSDWGYLFGATGESLATRTLSEAILSGETAMVPRLGWLVALGSHIGLSEQATLSIAWWALLLAGCGLIAGIFSRSFALTAWFIHLCAAKSGNFVAYGVDNFMTIGLFYLMLSPLPDHFSLDRQWRKLSGKNPSLLGFFRRVLQIHLCFIYFFGGLAKCLGNDWWNGLNLWRALTRPPFNIISPDILLHWKYAFPIAGIAIIILEIGYPFFLFFKPTRRVWLFCILAMHAGIGAAMGMYLFAITMIALNLAAFGPGIARNARGTPVPFSGSGNEDVDLARNKATI